MLKTFHKKKRKETIIQNKELALISKQLVIANDVKVHEIKDLAFKATT